MPSVPQVSLVCTNSLTLQWTPAPGGYNATSYSISVVNGNFTLATNSTNATIGDLIEGTNYTVSVTSINCAGSSNSSSVSVQTCEWCVCGVCVYVCVCLCVVWCVCVCVFVVLTRSLCSAMCSS